MNVERQEKWLNIDHGGRHCAATERSAGSLRGESDDTHIPYDPRPPLPRPGSKRTSERRAHAARAAADHLRLSAEPCRSAARSLPLAWRVAAEAGRAVRSSALSTGPRSRGSPPSPPSPPSGAPCRRCRPARSPRPRRSSPGAGPRSRPSLRRRTRARRPRPRSRRSSTPPRRPWRSRSPSRSRARSAGPSAGFRRRGRTGARAPRRGAWRASGPSRRRSRPQRGLRACPARSQSPAKPTASATPAAQGRGGTEGVIVPQHLARGSGWEGRCRCSRGAAPSQASRGREGGEGGLSTRPEPRIPSAAGPAPCRCRASERPLAAALSELAAVCRPTARRGATRGERSDTRAAHKPQTRGRARLPGGLPG